MSFEPRVIASASDADAATGADVDGPRIEAAIRDVLLAIGEDPDREGLRDTPARVAASYADLFAGYGVDPVSVLEPLVGERGDGLIMMRAIPLTSVCEHHLLPFRGTAAVAYLPGPDGRITGLSKLARVTTVLARRLQVQERLVRQIADAVERALEPRGTFVVLEAEHECMAMRGARTPGAVIVTTDARGVFAEDPAARAELIALARGADR